MFYLVQVCSLVVLFVVSVCCLLFVWFAGYLIWLVWVCIDLALYLLLDVWFSTIYCFCAGLLNEVVWLLCCFNSL